MAMYRIFTLLLCLMASICLGASNGKSTSEQNKQAREWYQRGMEEPSHEKRVPMFLKAIQLNPTYIDAYYQLGLSYKSLKNYPESEKAMIKAYSVKPQNLKLSQKCDIMFELGGLYLRMGRLAEAESTLLGAKDIAGQSDQKAKIAFELGRVFAARQKYAEALSEFRLAKAFDPQNAHRYDVFAQSMSDNLKAPGAADNSAVAQNAENSAARVPESAVSDQQGASGQNAILNALYTQGRQYEQQRDFAFALEVYQKIKTQSPSYKDVASRMTDLQRQLDDHRQKEMIETEFAAGVTALREKNWARAIYSFENVLKYDQSHRAARDRLREAKQGMASESTDSILARFYAEGLMAMKTQDFAAAIAAFEKVETINENYRNVSKLMVDARTQLSQAIDEPLAPLNSAKVDSLRRMADKAVQDQNWVQAVASLELLRAMVPEDERIQQQLLDARGSLQHIDSGRAEAGTGNLSGGTMAVAGAVAAMLVLPLSGVYVFSPTARARVHLLRGKYSAAATIYERIIARNPGRIKLYPALANIYMLTSRQDENALKVYKTVLQLDLPVQDRERMHSLMAQKYVAGESTDGDAIDILEKELQKEVSRKKDDA